MHPHNLWELFRLQWGPQRVGIGFLFTKALADISHWNTRAESFAIYGVLCAAMVTGLGLRARLFGRISFPDIVIPLLFFTPLEYEILTVTPIATYGVFPLLLLLLYCLTWTIPKLIPRYAAVLGLNFLLIYTSFGVLVGIITPVLVTIECINLYRKRQARHLLISLGVLALSLLSSGSFFIGYRFLSGVDNFQFPHPQFWNYPRFMALAFAHFLEVKGIGFFPVAHRSHRIFNGDRHRRFAFQTIIWR